MPSPPRSERRPYPEALDAALAEWFGERHTFAERNALYVETAVELGREAITSALERAYLAARDIGHIIFVSSTGISTPSIDALIANRIDFGPHLRRTPMWGLGCAGGAAALTFVSKPSERCARAFFFISRSTLSEGT